MISSIHRVRNITKGEIVEWASSAPSPRTKAQTKIYYRSLGISQSKLKEMYELVATLAGAALFTALYVLTLVANFL